MCIHKYFCVIRTFTAFSMCVYPRMLERLHSKRLTYADDDNGARDDQPVSVCTKVFKATS